jgi:hypothetical protein
MHALVNVCLFQPSYDSKLLYKCTSIIYYTTLISTGISQISDVSMAQDTPQYDRPDFFNAYLTLPRQQKGHDGAPEWPILRRMIGTVADQQVLDLGCGLGWFTR